MCIISPHQLSTEFFVLQPPNFDSSSYTHLRKDWIVEEGSRRPGSTVRVSSNTIGYWLSGDASGLFFNSL